MGKEASVLVRLASYDDDPPSGLIHTFEQQQRQKPVAKIVRAERGVVTIGSPRLLSKVLEACVEDEDANRRDLST